MILIKVLNVFEHTELETPNRSARSSLSKPNRSLIMVSKNSSLWESNLLLCVDLRALEYIVDACLGPLQYRLLGKYGFSSRNKTLNIAVDEMPVSKFILASDVSPRECRFS